MNIYLDNAATTQLSQSTKEYLINLLNVYGNPSSLHSIGIQAKNIISMSRNITAQFINASPTEIFFTSGGSASNTLAIKGFCSKCNCYILYSPIAHKSILECVCRYKNSHALKVDSSGNIDIDNLKNHLRTKKGTCLTIIDAANSEIGTIQNVSKIINLVHNYKGIVYLDCTGSISQIPLDVKRLNVDIAGFSAHKLGALKGCGVVYKKQSIELEPIIYGTQEKGIIGGTENVLGIASLGKAIENYNYSAISSKNRDYIYNYIIKNISDTYLIGDRENRLPYNLYICFKGVDSESLMILLDMNGIQVSTGSACSSGNLSASSTLLAIGIDKDDLFSCIRMTLAGTETKKELDYICETLSRCVDNLRSLSRKQVSL